MAPTSHRQTILGHSTSRNTQIYTHVRSTGLKSVYAKIIRGRKREVMPSTANNRHQVESATDSFLRHLRRMPRAHHQGIRRDLDAFARYIGSRNWKTIDHIVIRGFRSQPLRPGPWQIRSRVPRRSASLYRWLAQEGLVEQNPAKLVSHELAKKLPRVPTSKNERRRLDGKNA